MKGKWKIQLKNKKAQDNKFTAEQFDQTLFFRISMIRVGTILYNDNHMNKMKVTNGL